jgi:peptidoglycan/LPS O-acetylase OafA/YrhL
MTLTKAIVHDPPAARRFRRIAPVLVLLGLVVLVMVPGILVQMSSPADRSEVWGIIDQLVLQMGG